jgi:hypothetical protein
MVLSSNLAQHDMSDFLSRLNRLSDPTPDHFDAEESLLDNFRARTDSLADQERAHARFAAFVPRTERASMPAATKYAGRGVARKDLDSLDRTDRTNDDNDDDDDDDDNANDDHDDDHTADDDDDDRSSSVSSADAPDAAAQPARSSASLLADQMEELLMRNEREASAELQLIASTQRTGDEIANARAVKRQLELVDVALDFRIRAQRAVNFARCVPAQNAPINAVARADIDERRGKVSASLRRLLGALDSLRRATGAAHTIGDAGAGADADAEFDGPIASVWQRLEQTQRADAAAQRELLLHWSNKMQASRTIQLGTTMALNQDIPTQVERIMADKERVLRRCRTANAQYHVVGEAEPRAILSVHDDVYDDNDFYLALLRQVIGRHDTATAEEQLRTSQRALKRARGAVVDSSMHKGRRLQYNVHDRLVNFAVPAQRAPPDWDVDMLFDSLFQQSEEQKKRQRMLEDEEEEQEIDATTQHADNDE